MSFIESTNLRSKISELKRMSESRFQFPIKKSEELYASWERSEHMSFFVIHALENISKRLDALEKHVDASK